MCSSCFTENISFFKSKEEFLIFEKELDIKIWNNILIQLKNKHDYRVGDIIYKCVKCESKWILSIPDYSWNGYFIKESNRNTNVKIKNHSSINIIIIIVIVVVMTLIINML